MKTIIKKAFLSTALIITSLSGTSYAGDILDTVNNSKLLTVATNSDYRPNSFLGDKNQLEGFDIDVSKEVAKRLGVDVKFVTPGWEIMTAGRWVGRWHMAVGSMTPTKKRAQVLDFPAVYYFTPAGVAVHKDATSNKISDLTGKTFGVVSTSTYHRYLEKNLQIDAVGTPPFEYQITPGKVRLYGDINEFDDLSLGEGVRLDAVVQSIPVIKQAIAKGLPVRLLGAPIFYEPLAIAIDKGDKELGEKIASVVADMKSDGTLASLSLKWHGADYVTLK
ncbi:MAG: polar amino acid transport system substrate-binding protein [Oceanospirillaceae bacterium]|jgi:polar amino acid transport system substrate-binding protein